MLWLPLAPSRSIKLCHFQGLSQFYLCSLPPSAWRTSWRTAQMVGQIDGDPVIKSHTRECKSIVFIGRSEGKSYTSQIRQLLSSSGSTMSNCVPQVVHMSSSSSFNDVIVQIPRFALEDDYWFDWEMKDRWRPGWRIRDSWELGKRELGIFILMKLKLRRGSWVSGDSRETASW